MKFGEKWTDQYVEVLIGRLLQGGVMLASAVVLVGGIIYLFRHGSTAPQYRVFEGEPADMRTLSGIVRDALALRGRGVIQLGLVLLILTPVARVAFSVAAFSIQRDRMYVVVTLLVLVILMYSLLSGKG